MAHLLRLFLLAALIAGSGYVHAVWTDRWSRSAELDETLARLPQVPLRVGDWQGRELAVDLRQADRAGVAGQFVRHYEYVGAAEGPRAARAFTVFLGCGRAGPMAVHSPDVCYPGAGFALAGAPARWTVQAASPPGTPLKAEFWTAQFTKDTPAAPARLRLYWSWYAPGGWQAPDHPRLRFGALPSLCKLYVTQQVSRPDERLDEEACKEFLRELLPQIEKTLSRGP